MASATRRLVLHSRRSALACPRVCARARFFSTTPTRRARDEKPDDKEKPDRTDEGPHEPEVGIPATLSWANTPEKAAAQLAKLAADLKALHPDAIAEAARRNQSKREIASEDGLDEEEDLEMAEEDRRLTSIGFWAEGEEDMGPDEDYYGDDITSHGHGELQSHRYMREYARLIAWELPLLSQLARPFEPPTAVTPFRFRYTSYLGESHPAANKVVVQFSPSDLGLTAVQRAKLIKLSGPRYNPSSDLIKLAAEQFDTQTQNKRFLGETVTSLIAEAKDGEDTFEDVPFDFRHHKPKVRHEFPREWALTDERRAYLAAKRAETARLEDQKRGNGELVDGRAVIEGGLPREAVVVRV